MAIAAGTEVYNADCPPVVARGVSYTGAERDVALKGPVRALVEDAEGKTRIKSLLDSITLTDFQKQNLENILKAEPEDDAWRIGEAFAEVYLTTHKRCLFPWPDKWDERKRGSSLPGADLVGFQETNHPQSPFRFAFGEVKTSNDGNHPPSAMHGRHGLKQQLEDLRNLKAIRQTLFEYLAYRAVNAVWKGKWQAAASRFLSDDTDIVIFGFLVRDVAPHKDDLRVRASKLAAGRPPTMHVELVAVYMPAGSIATFSEACTSNEESDDAD
ncbi:MAG: hypothetical protein ABSF26_17575 [Thermoguttaceae bacterium]